MDFLDAARRWYAEVEFEATRLIEEGVPPLDANTRATEIVSARRRSKAIKSQPWTQVEPDEKEIH